MPDNSDLCARLKLSSFLSFRAIRGLRPQRFLVDRRCSSGNSYARRAAIIGRRTFIQSWRSAESTSDVDITKYENAPSKGSNASPRRRVAADFYRAKPVRNRTIHIIGVGAVGSFIAHSLRGIVNPPPVTLIFSRYEKFEQWKSSKQRLTLITDGDDETHDGFEAEVAIPRIRFHGKEVGVATAADPATGSKVQGRSGILPGESREPIYSLIVCCKAPFVLQVLSSVKHRLGRDSVVLFMQNGMGVVEEVNREIFQDPGTRPYYMVGINSHGINQQTEDPFTTTHAGFGTIALGILPHERDRSPDAPYEPTKKYTVDSQALIARDGVQFSEEINSDTPSPTTAKFKWTPYQRYLLRTLLRAPVLAATGFSPPDLLQLQLEKLAVNCIVNPLTVLLDARNGAILYNYAFTRTMRLLLAEISVVIRSLPELTHIPNVSQRFDSGRLETIVVGVAQRTQDNISSMLADTRSGRQTEIDYINGWIVKKGEELGIRCLTNYLLLNLVKGKANLIAREMSDDLPVVRPRQDRGEGDVVIKRKVSDGM